MCGGLGIKNPDAGPNSRAGPTNSEVVFAADLGGTHLRAATVDENGQINFRLKQKTPQAGEPGEIVRALVLAVRQCETQSKISGDSIRAISVVVPGSVNVEQGVVVKAPNLACLDMFRLTAALTCELKLPAGLRKDAKAGGGRGGWGGGRGG